MFGPLIVSWLRAGTEGSEGRVTDRGYQIAPSQIKLRCAYQSPEAIWNGACWYIHIWAIVDSGCINTRHGRPSTPFLPPRHHCRVAQIAECTAMDRRRHQHSAEMRLRGDRNPLWTDPRPRFRVHALFHPCCLPFFFPFDVQSGRHLVSNLVRIPVDFRRYS